ncbi:helix-turn-helix domain-containing protein [Actinomadura coerulea]|uniref:helix-turn-helix domain-containing protein n=1 Tax=Actinomadura coerulea TaxID=46159 RepID=UPI003441BBAA
MWDALNAAPDGATVTALAEASGTSRATVTKSLTTFEEAGRAVRAAGEGTGRGRTPDVWSPVAPWPLPGPSTPIRSPRRTTAPPTPRQSRRPPRGRVSSHRTHSRPPCRSWRTKPTGGLRRLSRSVRLRRRRPSGVYGSTPNCGRRSSARPRAWSSPTC